MFDKKELNTIKKEIIEKYWLNGFPLIPLVGKKAFIRGWTQLKPNSSLPIPTFPENYGVVLQNNHLVIDADPRNYKEDDDPFSRIIEDYKIDLKKTLCVKTGGGGFHLYLKKPPKIKVAAKHKSYIGLEFKTKGCQVVGPYSIHPDTKQEYEVLYGSPNNLQDAPPALVEVLKKRNTSKELPSLDTYQDDEYTQNLFIDFLQFAPLAVQGANGDSTTINVAMHGHDYGLPPEITLELMEKHWNIECSPPWEYDALAKKVNNAYKYAKSPLGYRNPKAVFKEKTTKPINALELLKTNFPPLRWIIGDILPEGLCTFAAPPKAGKSCMCLNIAVAVSTGSEALGSFPTEQGKVIYYALEDSPRRIKDRLLKIESLDEGLTNLFVQYEHPVLNEAGISHLEETIKSNPDCRLIIFDTYSKVTPDSKGNKNAYDNDYNILGPIQKLAMKYRLAIIIVTHHRKEGSDDILHKVMGSTAMTGAADTIWTLKKKRINNHGSLYVTGREVEEEDYPLAFSPSQGFWSATEKGASLEISKERQTIIALLAGIEGTISPKQVAEKLGLPYDNIKVIMPKMAERGQIFKESRGKYRGIQPSDIFDN